ncbi:MAG: CapA family protein [Verrucomicrobia bacterium]|nr:CapA family protein [Verrucomicrobiota bacterium]
MGTSVRRDADTLNLVLCGDVNLQHRKEPASAFALVKSELADADILFGNNEMCLFNPSSTIEGKPGWTQSDERMAEGLADVGFDVVSCANNVNYGASAILSSIRVLDSHHILHIGSGKNLEEARKPAIVVKRGVRFGFLAYTAVFFPHGHAATAEAPGVSTIKCHTAYEPHPRVYELPGAHAITRSWPDKAELERVVEDIKTLRSKVDVLVTYFHWGVSGIDEIAEYQRTIGHSAIDVGSDVVVGSHAHVPQGVEIYRNKAILYGLGNFAFDWSNMKGSRTGIVAKIAVANGQIRRVSFKPVWRQESHLNQPEIVATNSTKGRVIVDRLIELSAGLGTQLQISDEEVVAHTG